MPTAISITDATHSLPASTLHWLHDHLTRALDLLQTRGDLRLRLIADPEMAQAHHEFGGVEGTTDVLTFDLSDPHENQNPGPALRIRPDNTIEIVRKQTIDADILACIDEATRQSRARGFPLERELLLYALHGVLHCLGFDDHEDSEAARMHAVEDAILTQIGVGPVFRTDPPGHSPAS